MKNETKILNLFVGNDKYIPALNQAFKQGDMVCSNQTQCKYTGLPCTNNVWLAIFKYYLKSWKEILIRDRR